MYCLLHQGQVWIYLCNLVDDENVKVEVIFWLSLIETRELHVGLKGRVVVVIIWLLDLQLPVQSVSFTTLVLSLNPVHGKMYSIQYYVIKFVSDLRQVCGSLLSGTLVSSTNKTDCYDITNKLLKVALNTINQPTCRKATY